MNTILKTKTTLFFLLLATILLQARNTTSDSIHSLQLKQVTVKVNRNQQRLLTQLPDVQGTYLNAGKKNVVINSDLYGFPAQHYSITMESIERIEMVRGSAQTMFYLDPGF